MWWTGDKRGHTNSSHCTDPFCLCISKLYMAVVDRTLKQKMLIKRYFVVPTTVICIAGFKLKLIHLRKWARQKLRSFLSHLQSARSRVAPRANKLGSFISVARSGCAHLTWWREIEEQIVTQCRRARAWFNVRCAEWPRQQKLGSGIVIVSNALLNTLCFHYKQCFFFTMPHGPLTRYITLQVAHAPRMSGTFSPPRSQRMPSVSDPGVHHGTCVMHVPWRMSGSLTHGDGEHSRHSRRMRNPQFYVSGKRPIMCISQFLLFYTCWMFAQIGFLVMS